MASQDHPAPLEPLVSVAKMAIPELWGLRV